MEAVVMLVSTGAPISVMTVKSSMINKSVTANTNILSTGITSYYNCIFRIYACFDTDGVLSIKRTQGSTTVTEVLNGGNDLTANSAYAFDIIVEKDEVINLQFSVNATALTLKVLEIASGEW
jgi:hypothetical protein